MCVCVGSLCKYVFVSVKIFVIYFFDKDLFVFECFCVCMFCTRVCTYKCVFVCSMNVSVYIVGGFSVKIVRNCECVCACICVFFAIESVYVCANIILSGCTFV